MRQTHRRSRLSACLVLFSAALVVISIGAITLPAIITSKADEVFGPHAPGLGNIRQIYLSTLLLLQSKDLTQPVNPDGPEVSFSIEQGESVASIIGKLWQHKLISNPGVFRNYLQYTGLDTSLKAGEYRLSPSASPIEIAREMQSSITPDVTLVILAGWRSEEIANALSSSGLSISPEEFLQAIHSQPEGYSFSVCQDENSLEGYLFPGSYTVLRETTVIELIPQLLMNFEAHVTSELKNGFATQDINLCEAVILASIVQREAVLEEEMPLIASVFYNRLHNGSVLESDPTVQYAVGYNQKQATWWTNPLSLNDLKIKSPYNTYIYPGLPPGPISNPGAEALRAVAFPAQTTYYYFRSACDGSGRHVFAETFNEHLANECP